MAEIEGYQKIIDGARQVVENYKPRIEVRPEWPMVGLGRSVKHDNERNNADFIRPQVSGHRGIRFIKIENIDNDGAISKKKFCSFPMIATSNCKEVNYGE